MAQNVPMHAIYNPCEIMTIIVLFQKFFLVGQNNFLNNISADPFFILVYTVYYKNRKNINFLTIMRPLNEGLFHTKIDQVQGCYAIETLHRFLNF